ncbi:MAG: hypothetical protein MUF36_06255 [Bacteroidales bacterium]|nr:hypothetical protein [Bacteroidales bacterium]
MRKTLIINLIAFFSLFLQAYSQNDSIELSGFLPSNQAGLFDTDQLLEITLQFDISYFRKVKPDEEYQDAILTYYTENHDTIIKKVKLRSRGNFRRNNCEFPPIRLNLKKNENSGDQFRNIDKIKLVTHCNIVNPECVLKEYVAYKLFNSLTDYSFRVRLMKINYINTKKQAKPFTGYAFAIEPVEFLAARINSTEIKTQGLNQGNMKPDILNRVAIFNYMIGNYDWSVQRLQNVVILSQPFSNDPSLGAIVPYDFDYSGFVQPPYAIPVEGLPIVDITDRHYQGICRTREEFMQALVEFRAKEAEFYSIINEFPYLKKSDKKVMTGYLESFFNMFDKKNTIVYKLLQDCK